MAWIKERMIVAEAITDGKLGGDVKHIRRTKKFLYDFAVQGGAVGAITLTDEDGEAQTIPADAVIVSSTIHVITACTSGGAATLAFGITGTAAGFKAATAVGSYTLDAVFLGEASTPLHSGATAKSVLLTVAAAALTAGKIEVFVEYFEGS